MIGRDERDVFEAQHLPAQVPDARRVREEHLGRYAPESTEDARPDRFDLFLEKGAARRDLLRLRLLS